MFKEGEGNRQPPVQGCPRSRAQDANETRRSNGAGSGQGGSRGGGSESTRHCGEQQEQCRGAGLGPEGQAQRDGGFILAETNTEV